MNKILIDGLMFKQTHGGISRVWTQLLTRLATRCEEFSFYLHINATAKAPHSDNIHRITHFAYPPQAFFKWLSKRRVEMVNPDILHSTYYTTPLLDGPKNVVTVYDCNHEKFPGITGNTQVIAKKKFLIEKADALIAISETTKQDILHYTNAQPDNITVIYPAPAEIFCGKQTNEEEIAFFRKKYHITGPYWLYIGRRGTYKNFSTLLKAFVSIAPAMEGQLIVIGGQAELDSSEIELLIRHRLENRVNLIREISDEELRIAYGGATAFVFPSIGEGFGLPLVEAMASSCPVIASDIPVFHEIAAGSALYFDPHDVSSLADVMLATLKPEVRKTLIGKGLIQSKTFSWDKSVETLRSVYNKIL